VPAEWPVRILVVEDHNVVAEGLAALLESMAGLEVVGIAPTACDAVELAGQTQPDVMVVDYHLPDASGAEVAAAVRGLRPEVKVVFLTVDDSDSALMAAVNAGASAYLLKSSSASRLEDTIQRAAAGEIMIPASRVAAVLLRQNRGQRELADRGLISLRLTPRESEILRLLRVGLNNRAIAAQLGISYWTVRSHVRSLIEKLAAHSKLEAVARAAQLGIL
jgi:DNA-binding NarL/FixJ family response regulator